MPAERPLVLVAHGTGSAQGRAAIGAIAAHVRTLRPGLDVRLAHVDVQPPLVDDVVLAAPAPPVVVPLLLSVGYHVRTDIARAVASRVGAVATAPLGPDPILAEILEQRLRETGLRDGDAVVLAAAGSRDPAAAIQCEQMAHLLGRRLARQVLLGYNAATKPSVAQAVSEARRHATRVLIASYLLAPGFFVDQLAHAGADLISAPLGPDRRLARLAIRRYDEAAV